MKVKINASGTASGCCASRPKTENTRGPSAFFTPYGTFEDLNDATAVLHTNTIHLLSLTTAVINENQAFVVVAHNI